MGFLFPIKWFLPHLSGFAFVFIRRPITACFVADLLQQVVVSLKISFSMGFGVGSSNGKVH